MYMYMYVCDVSVYVHLVHVHGYAFLQTTSIITTNGVYINAHVHVDQHLLYM